MEIKVPVGTILETVSYQYYLADWYMHVRGQTLRVIDYPELFKVIGWKYREPNDPRELFRLPPLPHGKHFIIKVKEAVDEE